MTLRLSLFVVLLGCGSSTNSNPIDVPATDTRATDVVVATDRPVAPSTFTPMAFLTMAPKRTFSEAAQVIRAERDYRAVMETDAGRIVLDLYEDRAPIAVNSFVFLSLNRYYEGIAFHRVLEGFVAQAGDPNTLQENRARWGTGGPGYAFDTETVDGLGFDGAGVLGMARAQSLSSNGSQFFITLAATTSLNGMYTVFGAVTEGADVLPRIARNVSMNVPPATPTRITRVTIEERAR
jgi:peptidylprolyl isomerase